MAYADVRDAIATIVATATGNAPVHKFERLVKTPEAFKALATMLDDHGNQIVHTWMMTVENDDPEPDTEEDVIDFTFEREYFFILRGYRGHDDAKETGLAWQVTIDAVLSAFDTNPTISGTAIRSGPAWGRIRDQHRFFGDILCHYCEVVVPVTLKVSRV